MSNEQCLSELNIVIMQKDLVQKVRDVMMLALALCF
jgi:hypothetical protein